MHLPYKAFHKDHLQMNWLICYTYCSKNPHGLKSLITGIFLPPKIPKMCDPILVTQLKMQPLYSQSRRKNATPSSGTSPLVYYWEVPPPPPPDGQSPL